MINSDKIILETPNGYWEWSSFFQQLRFRSWGMKKVIDIIHVPEKYNILEYAYQIAIVAEYKKIDKKIRNLTSIPRR